MSLLSTSMINSVKMDLPHAIFSPSQSTWLYDSPESFENRLKTRFRSDLGVELHDWACMQIQLGQQWTNQREILKSVRTMIFNKYRFKDKNDKVCVSYKGIMLLRTLQYIDPSVYATLKLYVNDCIKFDMDPEVKLSFSMDLQGTADAVKFNGEILRVSDLKTGAVPASFQQLAMYAVYFCEEHHLNTDKIDIELRLYQNGEMSMLIPEKEELDEIERLLHEKNKLILKFKGGKL